MNFIKLFLILWVVSSQPAWGQSRLKIESSNELKPRMVVLTDVSTWETDDSESLVRLLVHADLFEIEGLVFTTGWSLDKTRDDFFDLIHDAVNAYEKDIPNLLKRSNQKGFIKDESQQNIGYWPSPEYLKNHTVFGSKNRGFKFIGENNDSPGSELIIQLADEDDDRPIWITVWGGGNTLAQAIWRIQQDRSPEELKTFLHKLRVYTITDQDRDQRTDFGISSHQWMRREFEKDLFFIWDECAWKFQNGTGRKNWEEYAMHIQNHGNLGKVYPKYKYGVEGDTPAFLYLLPNGLNNPEIPNQVSWGGYFEWGKCEDGSTSAYTNFEGPANEICNFYENYFYPATFNNFAARMDWANDGKGNRNPVVILNGDSGIAPMQIIKKPGKLIMLDASKTFDPDNDSISFKWWVLPEAGTYQGEIKISDNTSGKIKIKIPSDSTGKNFHVICEVTDHGEPNLTSYRRIIISSEN
ncbi:MAG: DUF1593 domain-containing protein [Bacteroidales bacterium]